MVHIHLAANKRPTPFSEQQNVAKNVSHCFDDSPLRKHKTRIEEQSFAMCV